MAQLFLKRFPVCLGPFECYRAVREKTSGDQIMLHVAEAMSRLGTESAFEVLARAQALAAAE